MRGAGLTAPLEVNTMALECVDAQRIDGHINCQAPEPGKLAYRSATVHVTVYNEPTHTGRLTLEQMQKCVGMTIPEAKRYLKSIGHDGEVTIREQHTFSEQCG